MATYQNIKPAFGCVDGTHIEIKRPVENTQDFITINSFSRLQFRQFVIVLGDSCTLNADDLAPFMTLKSSLILKLKKICWQGRFQALN